MGLFKGLVNLATSVAAAPVAIVADAVTMGGQLNDRRESYSRSLAVKAERAVEDMTEDEWGDD